MYIGVEWLITLCMKSEVNRDAILEKHKEAIVPSR